MTEASAMTTNLFSDEKSWLPSHSPDQQEPALKFAPVSPAQHQVWLFEQLEPESAAYHVAALFSLSGLLQPLLLEQAFNQIIRRHEVLRTTFKVANDEPLQVIHPPHPFRLLIVDLSQLTQAEREPIINDRLREDANRPFDLSSGPLLRLTLIRLGERDHLLSLVTHHIVSDGWSHGVLLRELGQIYTALVNGKPDPLSELPMQYADFATWRRERLRGEELERHLGYWRRHLEGIPALLELPTDRPRPVSRSTRSGRLRLALSEGLTVRLRELSRRAGGTLFMTLLAAFNTLMSRYTAREDVVVGTPVAGRGRTEIEGLIGLFVNTLVLRTDLSGEPSFLEVLKRVREEFLDAYEHQDVPIEMLVGELHVKRSLSHTPLVQVLFNMLNFSASATKLPGLEMRELSPPETASKFDLTLYAKDYPEGLNFTLVYSSDLFDKERMRELLEQFQCLLEQVVEDPSTSITQYSLVTDTARKLLPDPARLFESEWRAACYELFSQQARGGPDRPALVDAQRTWTYQELDERSNQLAHRLLAANIQHSELIAIYAHRSAPLVCAILGILKAGAAFVILDPAYPEQRLIEYLRTVKPRGLLCITAAGELPPALNNFFVKNPLLCHLELHAQAAAEDSLAGYPISSPSVAVRPRDLAYVAFTSGSTGKPKAVMGTHDSLTQYPLWISETFGVSDADRFSMLSGLSHDPLLRDIFTPLLLGAVLCIPDPALFGLPAELAHWMVDEKITIANLTPAMGQLLNEFPNEDARVLLKHLRHSFFVGDALTWRDVSQFRRLAPYASCVNLYGSTETQRALSYYVAPIERNDGDERTAAERSRKEVLPVGTGIRDVQLLILNANRQLAGVGEPGEIYFHSPHLANGYWCDPVLTCERFVPNPFIKDVSELLYRTGDLGRYLPDGNVEMLGRVDRQAQIRGFRVEPAEVESTLMEHGGLRECVVIAHEHANGDKQLIAYVVPTTEVAPTISDLTRSLREKLPAYMIPSAFVTMKNLPLTSNGKIDRQALPAPDQSEAEAEPHYVGTNTPIEEMIAGILAHLLQVDQVGVHDNFFDIGGHSLLAMQLVARVRAALRVSVPLSELFETPTVAGLAKSIERRLLSASATEAPPIVQLPEEPEPQLSFSQEGLLVREWWEEVNELPKRPSQLASAFRLTGPLDLRLLERAINEIVCRHDILRATFPQTGGLLAWKRLHGIFKTIFAVKGVHNKLLKLDYRGNSKPKALRFTGGRKQIIRSHMAVPLKVLDLRDARRGGSEAEIAQILGDEGAIRFDYDRGPLLRVVVVRLAEQEHIVHFVLHHLICDAWSMRVLIREVLALYRALAESKPSPLLELPIQYADFARWQREWFRGEVLQEKVSYWKEQFSGVGLFPELPLPFIRARQDTKQSHQPVEAQNLIIPGPLSKSLKELGYMRGATTYMLFLAALNVLLRRYTGIPKISIYTPFANRSRVETQGLIGWVSNVHVLSFDCSGNPTFSELLGRVRETVLGAYAHQEVPYLQLVKTLLRQEKGYAMPRRVSEAPYVFFDYLAKTQTQTSQQVGSLTLSSFPLPPGSAAAGIAGLEVRAIEERDNVVVSVKYSPDVVEAARIERMLSEFQQLLQAVANSPEERIFNLPLA